MLRERRRAANFKPNRRLDRKSSRGMIYENEELRLRTININAEVERGQSDIRKLRRENEQLRREIWSLRDEYDRLDKILRQNKKEGSGGDPGSGSSRHHHKHRDRGYGEEDECEEEEDGECCSCNRSGAEEEDEEHCHECDSGEEYCDDENCNCCGAEDSTCDTREGAATAPPLPTETTAAGAVAAAAPSPSALSTRNMNGTSTGGSNSAKLREHLHVNFDHLSIVSEENLTGSDGSNSVHNLPTDQDLHNSLTVPSSSLLGPTPAKDGKDPTAASAAASHSYKAYKASNLSSTSSSSSMLIMSLPATPCSPLLNDFQSLVPPLHHFENINYDAIKPLPQSSSSSSSSKSKALLPRQSHHASESSSSSALVPSSGVHSSFISKVATAPPLASASQSSPSSSSSASPSSVSASTKSPQAVAAAALATPATDDVPSVAPSPEPPDSPAPSSSLPIAIASSVSSSDWMWNNKTVSFSTFRPPTASTSQPSLCGGSGGGGAALELPPMRKCDSGSGSAKAGFSSREEGEIVPINPMPRHFFSPLKSSRRILLPSSPDLYVHDVLASPGGSSNSIDAIQDSAAVAPLMEPIYSSINKSRPSYPLSITCSPITAIDNPLYASQLSPVAVGGLYTNPIAGPSGVGGASGGGTGTMYTARPPAVFQVGGNLDELLQEIEGMTDEVGQIDLSSEADGYARLAPVSSASTSDLTPPPNLPEPMSLLPATLPYLDFKSNTAIITTPKAAMANRAAAENSAATTTVTAVVSKPISSATAVRKKLFGKKNKDPIINEPDSGDPKAAVVPLKIIIPGTDAVFPTTPSTTIGGVAADDKVTGQNNGHAKGPSTATRGEGDAEAVNQTSSSTAMGGVANQKRKSRRVSLSFPGFGGGGGGANNAKKATTAAGMEDEKDTSSLENLANSNQAAATSNQGQGKTGGAAAAGKQSLHRVSSGAESISTSIGSPSTPIKGPCHHHRHNSGKKGKSGRQGHSRTSSESHNVYSSPTSHGGGHHNCDMRRNSAINDGLTTSMSERNSNSLASSRESSTSLSMRSQKSRRISENSHSGGKIPWCGCWGNGCL